MNYTKRSDKPFCYRFNKFNGEETLMHKYARLRFILRLFLLFHLSCSSQLLFAQKTYPKQYSNEQSRDYLRKINLDNWDSAQYAHFSFTHMCELFPCQTIHAGKPLLLEKSNQYEKFWATHKFSYGGDSLLIDEIIRADNVSGYIILYNGNIIYEKYPYMNENITHTWMSVTKPMTGALVAILEEKKLIDLRKTLTIIFLN